MAGKNKDKRKKQREKPVAIICIILLIAVIAGVFLLLNHISKLRADMNDHLEVAIFNIEQGMYSEAQTEADAALTLAQKLRDDEAADKSEIIIDLTVNVLRGNELFENGSYKEALDMYLHTLDIAESINNLDIERIEKAIAITEKYIAFFMLLENAERFAGISEYESAIFIYEDAKQIASALSFADGIILAESGIQEMQHLIIQAKREEAANLFSQGEQYLNNEQYTLARIHFTSALQIFLELDDSESIIITQEKIDYATQKIREIRHPDPQSDTDDPPDPIPEDTQDGMQDDTADHTEALSNFDYNSSIDFDLRTMIDNQSRNPANQIRMGSTEGMNEGWYNGCGWVATYNALILLGNPRHPAEIVRYFEESGGTVFDGVFGTYPNTIVAYLSSLGYYVNHTLFPQITKNIDDAIKASHVSILAYVHTSAAHYVTIEYNEDIDKFIVYNDSFSRTRSAALGLDNSTSTGAAIDSVSALISNTRDILFSFSLIIVS